jgi:hypothetical protein
MERSLAAAAGPARFGAYRAVLFAFTAGLAVFLHAGANARSAGAQTPRAAAAGQCGTAEEQSISEILALREHMVMLAMKCGRTEDYNTKFVARFPRALRANETAVTAWFAKRYGVDAAAQKDRYTTALVDIASRDALNRGQEYCSLAADRLIRRLDALKPGDDLARLAQATDPAAATISLCDWAARNP